MNNVVTSERPVVPYAQPLSRLQVSWGSILAGALTSLAVGSILWLLCLAIIFTATGASVDALYRAGVATWITGLICALIGAYAGGMVAGYLPGNPRRSITIAHGFLAWCLSFVLALLVQLSLFRGIVQTATSAAVTTASTAVQATGAAAGAASGGQVPLDQKAYNLLLSLGYTPAEAQRMVGQARGQLSGIVRGQSNAPSEAAAQAGAAARGALDSALSGLSVYTWVTFIVWALAAALSMLGARNVLSRVRKVPILERESSAAWTGMGPPIRTVERVP